MTSSFLHFLKSICCVAAFAAGLSTTVASAALAGDSCRVIVVRSADLQPHLEVVRGLRESCQCSIREVTLGDGEGPEKVIAKDPDLIIAVGTAGLRKLKDISSIPLIYTMAVPSEALRFQAPNISGVSMDFSPATHVAAMRQIFPGRNRIGLIYDPRSTGSFVEEAIKSAKAAGLDLAAMPVSDPSKVPAALTSMVNKIDVFWMVPDKTVVTPENIDLLLRFSFQNNVPVFTFSRKYLDMGAVVSLDADPYDIGVQAGELANKVRTGKASIREYVRVPHVSVNRKVAEKMGISISEQMIRRVTGID